MTKSDLEMLGFSTALVGILSGIYLVSGPVGGLPETVLAGAALGVMAGGFISIALYLLATRATRLCALRSPDAEEKD